MVRNSQTASALREMAALLFARRDRAYETCSFSDGHHIALVIEGGGMRAVTAGGMVSALEDLGLTSCFDSVHGSSAGAATGAYFLSSQASFGTSLFYEDINNSDFINPLNILLKKPILDTSYLVDYAMVKRKPINFKELQGSKARLYITCTDIDIAKPYIVSEFENYDHYRSLLKASITLPLIAGVAPTVDGRRLLDGGLLQQIAIDSAIQAGATHILALLTRTEDELERTMPTSITKLEATVLHCMYGGDMYKLYYNRNFTINHHLRQLHAGETDCGKPAAYISLPDGLKNVGRLTVDRDKLVNAAARSYEYTEDALGVRASRVGFHPRAKRQSSEDSSDAS